MTVLNKFPPCHIRKEYLTILKSPFKVQGSAVKMELLPTILDRLSDLIFLKNDGNVKSANSKEVDPYKYFPSWDEENLENMVSLIKLKRFQKIIKNLQEFESLPRNDRFQRLFLLLDLVVRILEYDASIFIIKYSHKFASSIANDSLKPLICSVIWRDFESVIVINSMIKQLIKIFVAMMALEYPEDKIKIISK